MMSALGIGPERTKRVFRTLRQSVYGLLMATSIALVANVTDIFKTEFGEQIWWPVAASLLTGVSAYLMHLRESKKA